MKITKGLNNNEALRMIIVQFSTIQSDQLVELTYKQ